MNINRKPTLSMIKHAAQTIAEKLHPKKIILFGSYAYGRPNRDSDVDLLIIKDGKKKPREYALIADKLLFDRDFSVDIIVRTSADIKKRLQWCDWFIRDIMNKGKVIYERPHNQRMAKEG